MHRWSYEDHWQWFHYPPSSTRKILEIDYYVTIYSLNRSAHEPWEISSLRGGQSVWDLDRVEISDDWQRGKHVRSYFWIYEKQREEISNKVNIWHLVFYSNSITHKETYVISTKALELGPQIEFSILLPRGKLTLRRGWSRSLTCTYVLTL